jgi:hypothetical protein
MSRCDQTFAPMPQSSPAPSKNGIMVCNILRSTSLGFSKPCHLLRGHRYSEIKGTAPTSAALFANWAVQIFTSKDCPTPTSLFEWVEMYRADLRPSDIDTRKGFLSNR